MADKYDADQLKALLAKGHALPPATEGGDPRYPIDDAEDLDNAIHAVGRGTGDHDDIRKYIIGRAKDLGKSDEIPENWNADGSLDESKSIVLTVEHGNARFQVKHTPAELREQWYSDLRDNLCDALQACYGDDDGDSDLYVVDCSENHVVWESWSASPGMGTYMQAFVCLDDGSITLLGDPTPVTTHTTYEPCDQPQYISGAGAIMSARKKDRRAKPRHRSDNVPGPGREFRMFAAQGLEVREMPGGGSNSMVITGLPIRYGVPYEVQDMFGAFSETMHRGVCKDVLGSKDLDVRFLFNHDGLPLGRTSAGTLHIEENDNGLAMAVELDLRQNLANDLAIAIERKDVTQMSCGFVVARDKWSSDMQTRDIYSLRELFDVSAVTYPASPSTSIEIGQRMWEQMPVESRARVRRMWSVGAELREGKVLSSTNAKLLQDGLDALARVDTDGLSNLSQHAEHVERAKTNLAAVLAAATPVNLDDDGTLESTSGADPGPSIRKDKMTKEEKLQAKKEKRRIAEEKRQAKEEKRAAEDARLAPARRLRLMEESHKDKARLSKLPKRPAA
jgi:HK97 family phage prohead protease